MRSKLHVTLIAVVVVLVITAVYQSNYLSYYNCMSRTKLDYITKKGAAHIAAQCRMFILEKTMMN